MVETAIVVALVDAEGSVAAFRGRQQWWQTMVAMVGAGKVGGGRHRKRGLEGGNIVDELLLGAFKYFVILLLLYVSHE